MEPAEALAADPMLSVLRERHPEVDVILLPTPAPPPADAPVATPEQIDALAEQTEVAVDELLARLVRDPAWPGGSRRESRWRRDDVGRAYLEVVVVLTGLPDGDNVRLLRATGNALLDLGWRAGPVSADPPRLAARRGAWSAAGSVREGALHLFVTSGHVLTTGGVPR